MVLKDNPVTTTSVKTNNQIGKVNKDGILEDLLFANPVYTICSST